VVFTVTFAVQLLMMLYCFQVIPTAVGRVIVATADTITMLSVITSVAFQASKVIGVRTLGQAITFDFVKSGEPPLT
jgi:hypothetical protein